MVKINCRAIDCVFWEEGLCTSDEITYDPEEGCLTYSLIDDVVDLDDDWDDDSEPLDDDDDDGSYVGDDGDLVYGFSYDTNEEELDVYADDDDW